MTSSSGFKSPAPVLAAMGLHSFHNDSPPFAGAPTFEGQEPDAFSLDARVMQSAGGAPGAGAGAIAVPVVPVRNPGAVDISASSSASSQPVAMPIAQRGFNPQPLGQQLPVAVQASGRLSLREPSVPVGGRPGNAPLLEAGASQPPTPVRDDSPPLTEPTSTEQEQEVPVHEQLRELDISQSSLANRRESKSSSKERDTAFDALNGLNDGEADLDESAPPAEGSTEAFLQGVQGEAGEYRFPRHRLRTTMKDESKIPVVIVACGSFSPPTYLHLRMFEMAKDEIVESQTYEIMAGYYSPVSSYYKKSGLAPALHRVRMCELAVEHTSTWLMVDPWEAGQPEYKRTAIVLDHFDEMLNANGGGITMSDGKRRRYKIMLLAGGDLIESFGEPGVWSEPDLHIILGRFGCLIVERAGSDVWAFLLSHDILYHHRRNVIVIKQLIYNDISSTKVRLFVRRGMSIKYLLPNSVIQYIYDHKLYRESDFRAIAK
ncbi:hypothetical protein EHS25_000259 [Saitozyma podzolica]|uniref:Cytidyltransferase-like domain-containing protein n=1 Tax=Saitozyma podzolica TaxID=1890683 RepID=A0A427YVK9_9TREE|nr:hypothetical protein EHS25_000259 [Saitozyma podzolica]